jgi:hypothetical protein
MRPFIAPLTIEAQIAWRIPTFALAAASRVPRGTPSLFRHHCRSQPFGELLNELYLMFTSQLADKFREHGKRPSSQMVMAHHSGSRKWKQEIR